MPTKSGIDETPIGRNGSAFIIREPYAASSDPTNLETRIERVGDEFVINGRNRFGTNALKQSAYC